MAVSSLSVSRDPTLFSNFASQKSMGFTKLQTTLLGIPDDAVQIISLIGSGWIAGRFKNMRAIMMVDVTM